MSVLGTLEDLQSINAGKQELMSRSVNQPEVAKAGINLPYQRRVRSISPPLQICSENYILYS